MIHSDFPSFRTRSAGRHRAGMGQRNMIIGAAAAGVIIVCSVIIIRQIFGGGPAVDTNPDVGYKCSVCGEEFVVKAETVRNQERDKQALDEHPDRTPDQAHCPKCGAKHAGRLMVQCPECKKWFLLAEANVRTDLDTGGNPVCPHCGLDLMKWKREHPDN